MKLTTKKTKKMKTLKFYSGIVGMIIIILLSAPTTNGTIISGDLTAFGTNLPAGNYEVVSGTNIYLPAGVIFTIDPGVDIYFENGAFLETGIGSALMMMENSNYYFETDAFIKIMGSFYVLGTSGNNVLFDKSSLVPSQEWKGIIFENCDYETVWVEHARIRNTMKTTGGAPELLSGAMYVDNCYFKSFSVISTGFFNNEATNSGGAVHISNSTSDYPFTFEQCSFRKNSCTGDGGAIACYEADIEILDCRLTRNEAYSGGSVYICNTPSAYIEGSTFYLNNAHAGGAFMLDRDTDAPCEVKVYNNRFIKNESSGGYGGGFFSRSYHPNYVLEVENNMFRKNYSDGSGGGIYIYNQEDSEYILNNNDLEENISSGSGGGMCAMNLYGLGRYDLHNNVFVHNESNYGGGINFFGAEKLDLLKNTFDGNIGNYNGGGFFGESDFTTLEIKENVFKYNEALAHNGGAVCFDTYSVTNPMLILLNKFYMNEAFEKFFLNMLFSTSRT